MNETFFRFVLACVFVTAAAVSVVSGQTPDFTYQGRLLDSSLGANGNYDFDFKLYDAQSNGNLLDERSRTNVSVSTGIFTVRLDFPATDFDGTDRFLEISVRPTGSPNPFTTLAPRQPITSTPYSVRSLSAASADLATNSNQLGGIAAGGFIQNSTSQQPGTSFNISGNGVAAGTLSGGLVNAANAFTIGGTNVLSTPGTANTFVGIGSGINNSTGGNGTFVGNSAGLANNTGDSNSFFGSQAGKANTTGGFNSFFGVRAGAANTGGGSNSFFGVNAGLSNTTGIGNSFFGTNAGSNNSTASENSFFGFAAGESNSTGTLNSFFGYEAGLNNTTGQWNSFFGGQSGIVNSTGSFNSFFGFNSGNANTTGINNSFFGQGAGFKNTVGQDNTFLGNGAGVNNTSANGNSFIGSSAGAANTTGIDNTFVGFFAGAGNTTACCNAFVGAGAGQSATGGGNSFFGSSAGISNTSGVNNTFVGINAGVTNTTGGADTVIGSNANLGSAGLSNATAIGANAQVNQSNAMVLGGITGVNGGTDTNVGIGTASPQAKLHISGSGGLTRARINDNANAGLTLALNEQAQWTVASTTAGLDYFQIYNETLGQTAFWINPANNNLGIGTNIIPDKLDVNGTIGVVTLGSAGSTALCRNASSQISTCSSSIRYKKEIQTFSRGLDLLNQLRPIAFRWKTDNSLDVGFGAEDVAKVEPLLVTRNSNGEIEGVKYDRITTVLVNAVREQQAQIEMQRKQIEEQKELLQKQQRQIIEISWAIVIGKKTHRRAAKPGGRQ